MNNEQAKFLLRACRPGGQDSADPAFAEALEQANHDPVLQAWLERERSFDGAVAAKLKTITPPATLRSSILAGVKASRPAWTWRRTLVGAGLAASFALVAGALAFNDLSDPDATLDELVRHGFNEMAGPHPRGQPLAQLASLGTWLQDPAKPLGMEMPVDLDELRVHGCRNLQISGKEVFEICFRRDSWYHIYIARRGDFMCEECEVEPMFRERGEFASVTWVDDQHVYVVVSRAGLDAVKRVVADPARLVMRE